MSEPRQSPTAKELYESGSGGPVRHADQATFSVAVEAFVIACRNMTDASGLKVSNDVTLVAARDTILAAMKSTTNTHVILPWDNQEDTHG